MTDYSLDDELTRKAGEAALWLDGEIQRGALTKQQAFASLVTFDMITLGLIDPKFNEWTREQRDLLRARLPDKVVMHRFESAGAETVISVELDRTVGRVVVTQLTRNPTHESRFHTYENETDQISAACDGYLEIVKRLRSKGLVVVA